MAAFEPNDPELAHRYFADKLRYTTGPVELSKVMRDGTVRIVDVRATKDFVREHIPGSVSLPEKEWSDARGLARDRLNVLLCYSGVCHLAARAAVELAARGYPVMELFGGFEGWKAHGLPTETGEAAAPEEAVERTRALLEETRRAAREEPPRPRPDEKPPEAADAAPKEKEAEEGAQEEPDVADGPRDDEGEDDRSASAAKRPRRGRPRAAGA